MSTDSNTRGPDSATGERILETAFVMFGRYGYDGVSIDQIAKACKLSKGALYWYYRNKEALFVECLKRLRKLLVAHIYGPMAATDDPREQMRLFFLGIESALNDSEHLDSLAGLLIGIGRTDKQLVKDFRARARVEAEEFIGHVLEQGRQRGQFQFNGPPRPLSRALFVIVEGAFAQARAETAEQTADALHQIAIAFFLAMQATPPADLLRRSGHA
ncbi:MAG: TetR/AcrR family transcriptional regulator [Pseudomonadota bacterium]|nr:TetR/AcrR family transcriptional regulator [Pseudomonadota bacterium]HJO35705.1 TetR/AcrR family transcriptional regulator [Gammaproteobacteria bacterium]